MRRATMVSTPAVIDALEPAFEIGWKAWRAVDFNRRKAARLPAQHRLEGLGAQTRRQNLRRVRGSSTADRRRMGPAGRLAS
jgi:hypothetical protein